MRIVFTELGPRDLQSHADCSPNDLVLACERVRCIDGPILSERFVVLTASDGLAQMTAATARCGGRVRIRCASDRHNCGMRMPSSASTVTWLES